MENGKKMTEKELEEFLDAMEHIGLKPVIVTMDDDGEFESFNYKDPEEFLGRYRGSNETLRTITISKITFNKACDTVIFNHEFSFDEIITLARFTAEVRYLLFDKDRKTEKEEN